MGSGANGGVKMKRLGEAEAVIRDFVVGLLIGVLLMLLPAICAAVMILI